MCKTESYLHGGACTFSVSSLQISINWRLPDPEPELRCQRWRLLNIIATFRTVLQKLSQVEVAGR